MPLETLAAAKARLGIATSEDDALLTIILASAGDYITTYCQRPFGEGDEEVPATVLHAEGQLLLHWFSQVKTEQAREFVDVTQQKQGDTFAIYAGAATRSVPPEVTQLLQPYRVPVV